ncbi:MAG: succinate dehydrogenase cytochrome b subunit [Bacteroidales bacterium]
MNRVLYSSISKKFVMALAGLFILTFLPVHLVINLMLLNDDPEPFNKTAHFMASFPVIKVVEVLLFLAIMVHIVYGILLQIQNWMARPVGYKVINRSKTSPFSRFMIWTGGSIFIFLILHFFNFYFIKLGLVEGDPENFYAIAHQLFKIPIYNIIYWVCFIVLGFHLYHAFYSAFQTLGLNHRIWTPVVRVVALIYAVLIPLAFAYIPFVIWILK